MIVKYKFWYYTGKKYGWLYKDKEFEYRPTYPVPQRPDQEARDLQS